MFGCFMERNLFIQQQKEGKVRSCHQIELRFLTVLKLIIDIT